MKRKYKVILTGLVILVAALAVGLTVWLSTPKSLEQLSQTDFSQAASLSAHVRPLHFEDGLPVFVRFSLDSPYLDNRDIVPGTEHFAPLLERFKAIEARPSLTNLWPWHNRSLRYGGNVDYVDGFVSCGDSFATFTLTSKGELVLRCAAWVGPQLYFLTDSDAFDSLFEYVTTHGVKNASLTQIAPDTP